MDVSLAMSALGATPMYPGTTRGNVPAPTPAAQVAAPAAQVAAPAASPAVEASDADAPSPTPAVVQTDLANLPLSIKDAPSPTPHAASSTSHFDRSA